MTQELLQALIEGRPLSEQEHLRCAEYARDTYAAARQGALSADEDARFRLSLEHLTAYEPASLEGLTLSFHPTARFISRRHIKAQHLGAGWASRCLGVEAVEGLVTVFVDPAEFNFRTFENIITMDRFFGDEAQLSLEVTSTDNWVFTGHIEASADLLEKLAALDELGLYVPPLNPRARGGERFIFHAETLSRSLTSAIKEAIPAKYLSGFAFVNPVFRCNAFEPDDAPFAPHLDTPYYDAANDHVSCYTMLIYLTGGQGRPALKLGRDEYATLDELSFIIFPQDIRHEGAPYIEGRKVFLRTELIFTLDDLQHHTNIGALFSQACYLTGESTVFPELERYASDAYDKVAAAHWDDSQAAHVGTLPVFMVKHFKGIDFITNGYDAWFSTQQVCLEEAATLAVLDYFNCALDGTPLRLLSEAQVVEDAADTAWIAPLLQSKPARTARWLDRLDIDTLCPSYEHPSDEHCCPDHTSDEFDGEHSSDVLLAYESAKALLHPLLVAAPILLMGQELSITSSRFVIEPGRITILSPERLKPINFAACWSSEAPADYLDSASAVDTLSALLPPLLFDVQDSVIHLRLDLFRNTWTRHSLKHIPLPTPSASSSNTWRARTKRALPELERALEDL